HQTPRRSEPQPHIAVAAGLLAATQDPRPRRHRYRRTHRGTHRLPNRRHPRTARLHQRHRPTTARPPHPPDPYRLPTTQPHRTTTSTRAAHPQRDRPPAAHLTQHREDLARRWATHRTIRQRQRRIHVPPTAPGPAPTPHRPPTT